jgi:hypothetical protein
LLDKEIKNFIRRTNTIGELMNRHSMQEASIPNPALEPFGVLIGHWNTTGTHALIPDTILHGRASFEWLEGGAFLLMRSEINEPDIPSGIAIIGSDDSAKEYFMLLFDERGVSRKYEVTLRGNVWKWWRNVPGFSQRYEGTIVDGGNTIIGKGELSKDSLSWEADLDLTYRRVE